MTDLFQDDPALDTIDPTKKYLEELVGEGKKFSDPEALARGKAEADLFIERLKQENVGIRNELNSRVKMEEFLDKLNSSQQAKSPDAGQQPSDQAKAETSPNLKPEDVIKLLDQREQQSKAVGNVNKVKERLQEVLGPNYTTKLKQVASNLNLSTDHLNSLASTSPEAFYKLIGLEDKKPDAFQAPMRNQMQVTGFKPENTVRDWDYYQKLKADKGVTHYWSTAVQNQLHLDAHRLGDKFKP